MAIESHKHRDEAKRSHESREDVVVARRARLSDRLKARLSAHQLDRALASGAGVESMPALALRARRLTALPDRRTKAATYRRILREASEEVSRSYARIAPRRERIVAASPALSRLADALAQPGPVAARGAAQASLLLTDGTGPLYNPANHASLERQALRALADLALS